MGVSVLLEQMNDNGYRATALLPAPLVAEAPTRDEAVARIRNLIAEKLAHAELIQIEIPTPPACHPLLRFAGTWADDPVADEMIEYMKEYRRELDSDPNRL